MRKSLGKSSIIFLLAIFVFTMGFAMLTIVGAGKIYSGNCGANGDGSDVKWSLNTNTGELTIKGSGAMKDYKKAVPWNSHRSQIITITMSEGITSICNDAFRGCSSLTSITIPNSVTSISNYAFAFCSGLTSIIIPDSVTSIGDDAFYKCTSIANVTIGSGVTTIGESAFNSCRGLTSVTINALTPPKLGDSVFDNTNDCTIYVPAASVDAYKAARIWSAYKSRIQPIPNS